MSEAFDERMKLIRFRRKKERFLFREEIKIVPKWVEWTCVALWLLAIAIGTLINLSGVNGETFPPDSAGHPAFASLALALFIPLASILLTICLVALAYVRRRARRPRLTAGLVHVLTLLL